MSAVVPPLTDVCKLLREFFSQHSIGKELEPRFAQLIAYIRENHPKIYNCPKFQGIDFENRDGLMSKFIPGVDASTLPGREITTGELHELWREDTLEIANQKSVSRGNMQNECAETPRQHKKFKKSVQEVLPTSAVECFEIASLLLKNRAALSSAISMMKCGEKIALQRAFSKNEALISLRKDVKTYHTNLKDVLHKLALVLPALRTHTLTTALFESRAVLGNRYPGALQNDCIGICLECEQEVMKSDRHGHCKKPVETENNVSNGGIGYYHFECGDLVGYRNNMKMAKKLGDDRNDLSHRYPAQGTPINIGDCVMCGEQVTHFDKFTRSQHHGQSGPLFHTSCADILGIDCDTFLATTTADVDAGPVVLTAGQLQDFYAACRERSVRACTALEARNVLEGLTVSSYSPVQTASSSRVQTASSSRVQTASSSRGAAASSSPVQTASSSRGTAASSSRGAAARAASPEPDSLEPTVDVLIEAMFADRLLQGITVPIVVKGQCVKCHADVTNHDRRGGHPGAYIHATCAHIFNIKLVAPTKLAAP